MVRSARFIFLAFHDQDRLRSPAWGRNSDLADLDRSGTTLSSFAWLLASPNNRELGRSHGVWDSYSASWDDVGVLQAGIGRAESSMGTDTATGLWTWRITLDGEPVARSGRMYHRERECRYSLRTFLAAVPEAQLVEGVRKIEARGRASRPRARVERTERPERTSNGQDPDLHDRPTAVGSL